MVRSFLHVVSYLVPCILKCCLILGHIAPPPLDLMSPLILPSIIDRPEWRILLSKSSKFSYPLNATLLKMGFVEITADNLFERLSDYDYQKAYRWRRNRRLENTTRWILEHSDFLAWLRDEGPQCLWLSGIGGLRYMSVSDSIKY